MKASILTIMLNQRTQDAAAQKRSARLAFNDEVQAADDRDDIAVLIIFLNGSRYVVHSVVVWRM